MPNSALIGKTTGEVADWIVNIPSVYGIRSADGKGALVNGSEVIQESDMLCFVARSTEEFMTITTGAGLQDPEWPQDPNIAIFGRYTIRNIAGFTLPCRRRRSCGN